MSGYLHCTHCRAIHPVELDTCPSCGAVNEALPVPEMERCPGCGDVIGEGEPACWAGKRPSEPVPGAIYVRPFFCCAVVRRNPDLKWVLMPIVEEKP